MCLCVSKQQQKTLKVCRSNIRMLLTVNSPYYYDTTQLTTHTRNKQPSSTKYFGYHLLRSTQQQQGKSLRKKADLIADNLFQIYSRFRRTTFSGVRKFSTKKTNNTLALLMAFRVQDVLLQKTLRLWFHMNTH